MIVHKQSKDRIDKYNTREAHRIFFISDAVDNETAQED